MKSVTYLKLILSAFFWGGSAIAGKLAMQYFSVSIVTFLRFAIAALVLGCIYFQDIRTQKLGIGLHLRIAFTALFGITLCYYFYFSGLHLSSAFNAGIIEATIPCLTLFIAIVFGKTRKAYHQIMGFVVAYLGVLYIIFRGDITRLFTLNYSIGDLLLLISTFCFAIYNVLVEKHKKNIKDSVFMFYIFYYGCLVLLLWPIGQIWFSDTPLLLTNHIMTLSACLPVLFMSVGGSVIAYLFFNQAIGTIGAANASSFINFVPIITVILSIFYLGEHIVASQWTGAVVIFIGVAISNYEPKHSKFTSLLNRQ
jgi:drug/metabolite transporter (DMT)-like permease